MSEKSDRVMRLMEDQDLKDAFEAVRQKYHDAIERAPIDQSASEAVMDIVKCLRLLGDVKQALYTAIQDGHIEDFNAQEKERLDVH